MVGVQRGERDAHGPALRCSARRTHAGSLPTRAPACLLRVSAPQNSGDTGGIVWDGWSKLEWTKLKYMMYSLGLTPWYKDGASY